jgi:AcrR family transcriptional regulator
VSATDGDGTRARLLDTAERLFARQGPDGVSIRAVNSAAGLAPAAVHYHFGSKHALLVAVMKRRGDRVAARHLELLDELERRPDATPRDLVEGLAQPLAELIADDPVGGLRWVKLAARLALARHPVLYGYTGRPDGVNDRFQRLACRVLEPLPAEQALLRWSIAGTAVLTLLADASTADGPASAFVAEIIDFVAHGVAPTRAAS